MTKAKEILVTQVKLVRPLAAGGRAILTTWIDASPRLKKGNVIHLKKDDSAWVIEEIYGTQTASDIDSRGYDNNDYSKHEGLKLG